MKKVVIRWGENKYKLPLGVSDYYELSKGSKVRKDMYRMQEDVAWQLGQGRWVRDRIID